jgi:putative flippase GtrA
MSSRMRTMPQLIHRHWPRHRDKVMYLVAGAWNTLFSYGCFSLLYHLLHEHMPPSAILAISYVVASIVGFLTMRYLVFTPVKHAFIEYLRYQVVYLPILMVNLVVLPLALRYSDLNAYAVQALFAVFAVIAGYLGNKYFTFHKPRSK